MKDNLETKSKAWYALRRTLPMWSFEDNLAELVEKCPEYGIDEVIIKVDTEEFSHGIPTFEWLENYQSYLFKTKEALNKIGVVFSINPWVTLGHCERGRNLTKIFGDMGFMVGSDGTKFKARACPLSDGWRCHTKKLWQLYAQTEPDVLWVEDDIKTFGYSLSTQGCFCDIHMDRFSKIVGHKISREEIAEFVLFPGKPHPYRKLWFELQRDVILEVAEMLEKTVHEISPETKMGLMTSNPDMHSLEGRDWSRLAKTLAGANPLVVRPCMGNYSEDSLRGLYISGHLLRATQYCLPDNVIIQTEVENLPFTQYSKSNSFTFLQMAFSFSQGSNGVTMNLFDHCGTPMASESSTGKMLGERKTFLNGMAKRCLPGGKGLGVRILHHTKASEYMELGKNADFLDLRQDGYEWQPVLESLGAAITFNDDADVVAISGQTIRAFTDEQIRSFLSKGALIDLSAMRCLIEMGYEELLGVSIKREFPFEEEAFAAEEFFDEDFGGKPQTYLTLNSMGSPAVAELSRHHDAKVLSRLVDPDCKEKYPFVTVFENKVGGRIALYPIDINQIASPEFLASPAFLNSHRQRQLYNVLKWLSKDKLPLFVRGAIYPLAFRSDYDKYTIVGVFNLCLDEWPCLDICLYAGNKEIESIDMLNSAGQWETQNNIEPHQHNGNIEIKVNQAVSFDRPAMISINWK